MRVHYISLGLILAALSVGCTGCADDPSSRGRIAMRHETFAETIRSAQRREDSGPGRVERAQQAVQQWWLQDEIEFAEGLEQIGDYAW